MRRWLLILACLALCVCAALDGWSTHLFLDNPNMSEGNPLFGPHPSEWQLWTEGTALIGMEILFAWWASKKRPWLTWLFVAAFLVQCAIHLHFYHTNGCYFADWCR